MIKKIVLLDREVAYDLQRKNVKNINLRIKPDKSVTVSANNRISEEKIENFLKEKEEYICKALAHYEQIEKMLPNPKQYVDGETFKIFGRDLRLKVFESKKNSIENDEAFIKLYVKDVNDFSLKNRMLNKWIFKQLEEKIKELCESVFPIFKKHGIIYPQIRFRKMVSRWGSCQPKRNILTFNYALVSAPIRCIEYVVYHEFTHFMQPNHSRKFYLALSTFLPDWKDRKKELENIPINYE
jgi:predicted metal-dependent hydrolase